MVVKIKPETKFMFAIFGGWVEGRGDECFREEVDGVSLYDALMEALNSIQLSCSSDLFKQRYRRLVLLRFGFRSQDGKSKTLEEVGVAFGLTRERIRQIEAKTLWLLRHPSRARKLEAYIKLEE